MLNQMRTIKVNRFTSYIQQSTYLTQSPTPSPNDYITLILFYINQWLSSILNHLTSFWPSSETWGRWLDVAGHWLAIVAPFVIGGALLICILCFCLPLILSCLTWVMLAILKLLTILFNLIQGLFRVLFNLLIRLFTLLFNLVKWVSMVLFKGVKSVFSGLCCCCKMMKAPGTAGAVFISRAVFEAAPAAYFQALRAGSVTVRLLA